MLQFYSSNSKIISYYDTDPQNDQKAVLFCFCGAASDYFDWLLLCNELSEKYRVLVLNRAGFIESSPSKLNSVESDLENAHELIQDLSLKELHLLGHSLGFLSALVFYQKYKEVFTISSLHSLDGITLDQASITLLAEFQASPFIIGMQKFLIVTLGLFRKSLFFSKSEYPSGFLPLFEQEMIYQKRTIRNHSLSILNEMKTLAQTVQSFQEELSTQLDCPILFVNANDKKAAEESNEVKAFPHLLELVIRAEKEKDRWREDLQNKNSDSEMIEIKSSHFLHGEKPSELAILIDEFIEKIKTQPHP